MARSLKMLNCPGNLPWQLTTLRPVLFSCFVISAAAVQHETAAMQAANVKIVRFDSGCCRCKTGQADRSNTAIELSKEAT
ncbi:MAG: hypothetical protein KUL75_10340 [Sterolibacterium sp.]|nr:hypothetical protein [Sterolibacterium sp.]